MGGNFAFFFGGLIFFPGWYVALLRIIGTGQEQEESQGEVALAASHWLLRTVTNLPQE